MEVFFLYDYCRTKKQFWEKCWFIAARWHSQCFNLEKLINVLIATSIMSKLNTIIETDKYSNINSNWKWAWVFEGFQSMHCLVLPYRYKIHQINQHNDGNTNHRTSERMNIGTQKFMVSHFRKNEREINFISTYIVQWQRP